MKGFVIKSRELYWNGMGWTPRQAGARRYPTKAQAMTVQDQMFAAGVVEPVVRGWRSEKRFPVAV